MHGTTPPEPPQSSRAYRDESPLATLPLPGNAELLLYLLVVAVIGIVTLVSDQLGAGAFVSALQWLTIAYILSRGIAKATRVYEL
ncbi:MAG TPA: hypothetical protein VNT23_05690 [Gaiellaceae bacterium]|nr:hypothetical protein [Gaiellaceae bacterium]